MDSNFKFFFLLPTNVQVVSIHLRHGDSTPADVVGAAVEAVQEVDIEEPQENIEEICPVIVESLLKWI